MQGDVCSRGIDMGKTRPLSIGVLNVDTLTMEEKTSHCNGPMGTHGIYRLG